MIGKHLKRFPFDHIANFRDLGGYPIGNEGMSRYGVFFRSTHLGLASNADLSKIKAMGIRTVIDLRCSDEISLLPDACMNDPEIHWANVSLMGDIPLDEIDIVPNEKNTPSLVGMYKQILTLGADRLRELFMLLPEAVKNGAVLFHCAAGKDRTGITAMFLLSLCGVSREDIISDYEVSHTLMEAFSPEDISGSNHSNMHDLLDFIAERHGSPRGYLMEIGVTESALETLKSSLYEPF